MKIYVAGKFEEKEKIERIQLELYKRGHYITHDWTVHEITNNLSKLKEYAYDDMIGVMESDLLIVIMENDYNYKGVYVEIGIALGRDIPVIVIGNAMESCIFSNLNYHIWITNKLPNDAQLKNWKVNRIH